MYPEIDRALLELPTGYREMTGKERDKGIPNTALYFFFRTGFGFRWWPVTDLYPPAKPSDAFRFAIPTP